MSRREFSRQVKREAFKRADGRCEGVLPTGQKCNAPLANTEFHYDHIIPDALGGDPILSNCACLCKLCHNAKTTKIDVPLIAKSVRISDRNIGIKRPRQKIQSRGFAKAAPQRSASRPVQKFT